MVEYACSPSTWEVEVGGSGIQGLPRLHSKYRESLDYMWPCLKMNQKPKPKTTPRPNNTKRKKNMLLP